MSTRTAPVRMPAIAHVRTAIRNAHASLKRIGALTPDDPWCDIRLQVYEDGAWALRTGLSDYDLDHRGFWGADSMPHGRFDSEGMARALIGQCADAAAYATTATTTEEK